MHDHVVVQGDIAHKQKGVEGADGHADPEIISLVEEEAGEEKENGRIEEGGDAGEKKESDVKRVPHREKFRGEEALEARKIAPCIRRMSKW